MHKEIELSFSDAFALGFVTISGLPIPNKLADELYRIVPRFTPKPKNRKLELEKQGENNASSHTL